MSTNRLFVIKDTKANYYHPPQVYRNHLEAMRACENSVNSSQDSLFNKNSEDFSLFEVGTWDELTGMIDPTEKKHICDLVDLRQAN